MSRLDELKKKYGGKSNEGDDSNKSRLDKLKEQSKTSTYGNTEDFETFVKDYTNYVESAERNSNEIGYKDAFLKRNNYSKSASDLRTRLTDFRVMYNLNRSNLTDREKEMVRYLDEMEKGINSVESFFVDTAKGYSQWKTEDEYNEWVKSYEDRQEKLAFDTESEQQRLDELKELYKKIETGQSKVEEIKYKLSNGFYNGAVEKQALESRLEKYNSDLDNALKIYGVEDFGGGGLDGFADYISEKERSLADIIRLQKGHELQTVNDPNSKHYDPNFESYLDGNSELEKEIKDIINQLADPKIIGSQKLQLQAQLKLKTEELGATKKYNRIVALRGEEGDEIMSNDTFARGGGISVPKEIGKSQGDIRFARSLTEDEVEIYSYYLNKYGEDKAEAFLDSIRDAVTYRNAQKSYEAMKGNTALEIISGIATGLEQFTTGMAGAIGMVFEPDEFKGEYPSRGGMPTTEMQYLSGMVREDLADDGFKLPDWLGGGSLGQAAYDMTTTISNQLPSILASTVIGSVASPVAGQIVGNALLGASATGNAYNEMRRLGYDKDQARTYGLLVGGSEAGLQYLLGGISSLGGKLSGNAIKSVLSNVDNAFARVAIQIGGEMLSEGFEEGLQTVLEPWFKSIATGVDFEAPNVGEVLYSSLLGALTAGVFDVGGTAIGRGSIAEATGTYLQGKELVNNGVSVEKLSKLGSTFSADTVAHQLAGRVNEKTGAYTIGRLFNEINAELTTQNQNDIIRSLERKGVTSKDAKTIATALANVVAGVELSEQQAKALESNPVIAQTFNDVIINPNSTVNQRIKGYNEALRTKPSVAPQESTQQAKAEEVDKNIPVEESAENEAYKVSESGKTIYNNEDVNIKRIVSTDGDIEVELDNGYIVKASDLSLSSKEEALMYEMVAKMGVSAYTANEIINTFKPTKFNQASMYFVNIPLAYNYGKIGYEAGLKNVNLSNVEKYKVYNLGRAEAEVKAANTKKQTATKSKTKKDGIIYENGFTYDEASASEIQKVSMAYIDVIQKLSNVQVHVFESVVKDGKRVAFIDGKWQPAPNGFFRNGNQIYIDINAGNNAEGAMLITMGHEITHYIRKWNEKGFKEFADFLFANYNKNVPVDTLLNKQKDKIIKRHKLNNEPIPSEAKLNDMAYEELVADAMSEMLTDPKAYDKLVALKQKNRTLWQKIGEAIKYVLDKFKAALGIYKSKDIAVTREAFHVRDFAPDVYEKLQDLYIKAFVEADANYESAEKTLSENGIAVDSNTESASLMSVRDVLDDKQRDKVAKTLATRFDVTKEEAMDWLKAETSLASLILNPKYSQYLDYTADENEEAIKSNSDYPQGTVDFSNICKKRRDFTEIMNRILRSFPNHIFEPTDLAKIRTIMEQEGMEVACAICYVEDRRQLDSVVAQDFINSLALYREGSKTRPDGKPFNANQLKALKLIDGSAYTPSIYELISLEGRNELKAKNPAMEEAWVKFNNARGMQSVRLLLNDAEYKRQILKYNKNTVKSKNDNGGLRIYSFSDMEMFHLIDIIQVITDSATVGLSIQGYTKVNEYAKAVKDTGEKLNRSLIPKGDLGYHMEKGKVVLDFDTVEGIDINHPDFFDSTDNPNVGNIVIGINPTQIRAAMMSNFIDYIIPFHTGQSKEVLGEKGIAEWVNYKDSQTEKDIATGKTSKHQINIYTEVIQAAEKAGKPITNKVEFVNKFLEVCKENNLVPRFAEFLNTNENGDYVYTEGYHKFLVDFKTFDTNTGEYLPQMPVKPIFDGNYITKLLRDYVKSQKVKDAEFAKKSPKVLERITNEIIKPNDTKFSDRDSWNNIKTIQGLESYSVDEVIDITKNHIQSVLEEYGEYAEIIAVRPLGSRAKGTAKADSDLDIVVQYEGDIREDDMFNMLNDEDSKLYIEGIEVDINPIRADESGDIEDYLGRVYDFDKYNPKYSDRDSLGNELSAQQQEFFKDSKVRDSEGRLTVVYHGTPNGGFTEFKLPHYLRTLTSAQGAGYYFTDEQNARQYMKGLNGKSVTQKKLYKVYLNITNPLQISEYSTGAISDDAFRRIMARGNYEWGMAHVDVEKILGYSRLDSDRLAEMVRVFNGEEILSVMKEELGYDGVRFTDKYGDVWVAWDKSQIKETTNKTPTSDPDIRYSDRDYLNAVNKGDMESAQRMVDEAAKKAGYTIKAYHGSDKFGFTRFDPSEADDGISLFFSDSSAVAKSYTHGNEIRNIGKPWKDTPQTIKQAEEILKEYNEGDLYLDGDIYKIGDLYVIEDYSENGGKYICKTSAEFVDKLNMLKDGKSLGAVYDTYLKMNNPLVVDAKGHNWDQIDFIPPELEPILEKQKENEQKLREKKRELKEYANERGISISEAEDRDRGYAKLYDESIELQEQYDAFMKENRLEGDIRTREIARYAKLHGYDGVQINNVIDIGGYGLRAEVEGTDDPYRVILKQPKAESTIYVVFNSSQVKSADPVTYDAKGKVITPSKRFNTKNDDIRYSDRDFPNNAEDVAKEYFGTTKKWAETGFLLKDGTQLDFSGRHWTRHPEFEIDMGESFFNGKRDVEHFEIVEAFPEYSDVNDIAHRGEILNGFLNRGNIRIVGNGIVELYTMPTEEQFEKLLGYFKENNRHSAYVGIGTKDGLSFKAGTDESTIVESIRDYFEKGRSNQSDLMKFHTRYSDRYSYETLTSKPDMEVAKIGGSVPTNRADVVAKAKQNAASIGKTNKDGSVSVYVKDVDADVILSKKGLVHGLDRRFEEIAPVTVHAGEILKNSIKINELTPSKKEAESSYVLIGTAQNSDGELYVVRFIVSKFSNELASMEVLYAINAKKSTAVLNAPLVSTPNYRTTISIAELLDFVNMYFPDILPESVLRHYGYTARPDGKVGESALYSDRDTEARELSDTDTKYSIREEAPPKKTKEGYKVFVVKNGKLYPPMVANPNAEDTPVGVWLNADVGTRAADSKTGRMQVKAGGKGTQGGSGSLAFRPGWHLGETPLATQFDRLNPETGVKELFPENFVWALCDIAADHDYQEEAMSYGYTKNGKFQHSLAGLPKLPTDGYYKYRTNPNPDTVPWLITGAMKVKRLLSDAEVNAILESKGLPPKQRVGGDKTLADLGLSEYEGKLYSDRYDEGLSEADKKLADEVIRNLKDRVIASKYGVRNMATYTPERMDREISNSSSDTVVDYAKSYITWVKPIDFVYATTTSEQFRERLKEEAGELNIEKLRSETQPIHLTVDFETGEIVGHEGRHRMLALREAGVENVAVIIDAHNDDRSNTKPIEMMRLKGQRFAEYKKGVDFFLHNMLPLSKRYADVATEIFTHDSKRGVKFSDRDSEVISNRTLLANALESVAQNDIEKNKLKQYKDKIALIEKEQAKLSEIREKIKELSFAKGARDTEQIKKLQSEATMIANRINTYDRQLLSLESTTALKNVLQREKEMAYKKAKKEGQEALAKQKEKDAKTIREVMTRYQESRKKAVEGRNKTELRHKIKKVVTDLNKLLLHGTKERNVKPGLQLAVASALEAINMDTVSADARIAKLKVELLKAKTPEKIEEIQHSIDYIRNMGDTMADKLEALRKAYTEIKNGADNEYSDQFKEEASLIESRIERVIKKVGNTPLRDMSLTQLEEVYEMYTMVLTTIRNANSLWKEGKILDLQQNASAVMQEIEERKKLKDEEAAIVDKVRSYTWNEMTPYYAFDRIGSDTLTSFFMEAIRGQDVYARDVDEAKTFADKTRSKYNYKKWNLDKVYEFKLKDGRIFKTTLKHMLSIYAYSKRDQALLHMSIGGFFHNDKSTFRKKGGVLEFIKREESGYKIDAEILEEIKDAMTKDQLNYVDEMQEYLTKMGEKGNEVTRVLWGIDIFKEKIYFPLKSKDDFIKRSTETAQSVSLKNDGMTKETVPGASNPIVLEAFDDVWANHIERMSQYHGFVIPIDNLNKLHQYGTWVGTESMAVSTMLAKRFGSGVNEYITQFIKDLNGNAINPGAKNPLMGFLSKFKKTAVGASMSTVVQQPTAILRAMAIINPKYFVGKPNMSRLSKQWDEVRKYAPIAIIKEIGGFDAGSGVQTSRWLNSDSLRGVEKVMDTIDNISMKGAEIADQVGWTTIWEAVKREVKATTNLEVGSEAFNKKVGERFTEVIVKTQVYDSTLSRSGFMRSKSDTMKMLTAFMGEPTLSINMMFNAIINAKRGGSKLQAARTIGFVYASIVAASAMASFVYALRDDDEDESYLEKYMQSLGGEVISDVVLAPITSLPAIKDIVSIFQGWDVERTDVAIFKDIKDAFDGLDSETKSPYRKVEDFAGAIASAFGIPLKNLLRTGREVYNGFSAIFDNIQGGNVGKAFIEGVTGEEQSKSQKLYEAIVTDDKTRLEMLKKGYKDDKAYATAIKSALRENDSRIKEAAQARLDGNIAEYTRIARSIVAEGYFTQDTVVGAINAELNALKKGESTESTETTNKATSIYNMDDYYNALDEGATASNVKEAMIQADIANGKDRDEAEADFNSQFVRVVQEEYEAGNINGFKAVNLLMTYGDKTEESASSKIQYWDFKKEYPDYDLSESAVTKYYSEVEPYGITVDVYYDYSEQRSKCKGTDNDGDGRTDSGSVKAEVMRVINSLPISSSQKDALYYLNGWSASTLYQAPWH